MYAVIGLLLISVCTHNTTRTPSMSGFRGGPWKISNRLVTEYVELEDIFPLLF